jgi:hypothetical protein
MNEIITRQEAAGATAEPALTVSQLTGLLKAAADYERAQRPIVLHAPAEPALAPQTAPQPVPVTVSAGTVLTGPRRVSRLYVRSELSCFMFFGIGLSGALSAALTENPLPGAFVLLGIVGGGVSLAASNRDHDDHQAENGCRARHGKDKHGCPVTEA